MKIHSDSIQKIKVKKMNSEVFEEYFQKYNRLVIRYVVDKTGDYQTAQEICQQVFVAFYTNMDRISDELVKAWLLRCAQNAVIDLYRHEQTKREVCLGATLEEHGSALAEESVEVFQEKWDNKELVGRILREVREVNPQWFEILMMSCVEGLSYVEVARRLGISEQSLRARLYRARQHIREKFGEEYLGK